MHPQPPGVEQIKNSEPKRRHKMNPDNKTIPGMGKPAVSPSKARTVSVILGVLAVSAGLGYLVGRLIGIWFD